MKNRRNYYRLLHVQQDAPIQIIRAAYRMSMLALQQPDRSEVTISAEDLTEAYTVLTDPARRALYDKELFLQYEKKAHEPEKSTAAAVVCHVCRRPSASVPEPGERCAGCESPLQSEDPAEHTQAYERALARVKRDDPVLYYTHWPDEPQIATMIDISPNGIGILCPEPLYPGTVLKIRSRLCEASGTVTHVREVVEEGPAEQPGYAVGIAFLAVNFNEIRGSFVSTTA